MLKEGETEERRDNDTHKNETRSREERNRLESGDRIKTSLVTENVKDKRNGDIERNSIKAIDGNAKSWQNSDDDVVDGDAVELIQATMKGHMSRSKQIKS